MSCISPLKLCRARIIRLDECGKPVIGPKSVLVSDAFISTNESPDYEEGEEFILKNGCGDLCVNEKDCDRLKRVNLDMSLCTRNPDMVEMMTGYRLLLDAGGEARGWARSTSVQCDGGFSLELWQKVAGQACNAAGDPLWNYAGYPFITNGKIGDATRENAVTEFTMTAFSKQITADDQWGADNRGPFAVLPLSAALQINDNDFEFQSDIQPPAVPADCAAVPLAA